MTPGTTDMAVARLEHDVANLEAKVDKLAASINPELVISQTEKTIHIAMVIQTALRDLGRILYLTLDSFDKIVEDREKPDEF
jgi:hypothetical protein